MQPLLQQPVEAAERDDAVIDLRGNRLWRRFWRQRLSHIGVGFVVFLVLFSFVGPLVWHDNPLAQNILLTNAPPSLQHPLGTDGLGRDYLSRVMYGGRTSLEVGFAAAFISMVIGTLYGTVSALAGGVVDAFMMRIVDILLSIPSLFLLLFLVATFSPSALLLVGILAVLSWFGVSRLVRAEVLSLKQREFIEAQRASGAGTWRLISKGLFPNFFCIVLVAGTFGVADAILTLAALSFLGLGLPPPAPNWGGLLSDAANYMFINAWWIIYPPGLCILMAELGVNFIGDSLRVALDTRAQVYGRGDGSWPGTWCGDSCSRSHPCSGSAW
jgi:peptide/nickel transport system permease protein